MVEKQEEYQPEQLTRNSKIYFEHKKMKLQKKLLRIENQLLELS